MPRVNLNQWKSESARGALGDGVMAERLRGGVAIQVKIGRTFVGHDLDTSEADDLAKFIIDCGIAERSTDHERESNA